MKLIIVFILFMVLTITAQSQNDRFTISGGYVFANIEETESSTSGFRINGLYEYKVSEKFSHGFSFGYVGTKKEAASQLITEYKINNWPVYYAPKYYFGKGSFKGFAKGALGFHFSNRVRASQNSEIKANDIGFYGGAGLGIMMETKKNLFFNVEYEWAYLSNSYYRNGFLNSAMLGIGFKF
jgi:hypothetical protein